MDFMVQILAGLSHIFSWPFIFKISTTKRFQ